MFHTAGIPLNGDNHDLFHHNKVLLFVDSHIRKIWLGLLTYICMLYGYDILKCSHILMLSTAIVTADPVVIMLLNPDTSIWC